MSTEREPGAGAGTGNGIGNGNGDNVWVEMCSCEEASMHSRCSSLDTDRIPDASKALHRNQSTSTESSLPSSDLQACVQRPWHVPIHLHP